MNISPHQDLRFEGFSAFGSYMVFRRMDADSSPDEGGRGLYLRQCHGARFYRNTLAKLLVNGEDPDTAWDEAVLTLKPKQGPGRIDIVFDGEKAVRFRGEGCTLDLHVEPSPGTSMYPAGNGAWEVNARACCRKVLLHPLSGQFEALTDWQGEHSNRLQARIGPGDDGTWELALDLFLSTWLPRSFRPFDTCVQAVREAFAAFLDGIPAGAPETEPARRRAAWVLWAATVHPSGHFKRPAILMSKNHMTNVWSWDHAFNAMALMPGHPELAWDQMMLMADRQNEHGAFPDAQNDIHEHFNFCKPPIHGWALSRLRTLRPDFFTADRIRESLSWLEPWTRWWLNHRVREDGGLPLYLHGNDSGWDNSTFFLRGVPLLTPDLPAFLVLQCRELADLHRQLGQHHDAAAWSQEAEKLLTRLLDTLWDGERFHAVYLPENEKIISDTLIETMPLVLGDLLPEAIRNKLKARLRGYLTGFGPATEHPDSPHYTPDGYWRGPVWAPSTHLLIDGLRRGGDPGLADDIARRYCALCARSGFAENFDALTGAPLRDKAYTWTASVFLILQATKPSSI
ncbi:MAG: hypothetical protein JJU05_05890 [Verrucomicrobia bacterium]|nr:hypothetical protein [Verrucomicrobiota bacterium]MCH8525672.1 hypothetical protein [Kiritimatiellia bacterium]